MAALFGAQAIAQSIMEALDQAAVAPPAEVEPDANVGREVCGQVTPGASCTRLVEDSVEQSTIGVLAWASASLFGYREQRGDEFPLRIRQVTGVRHTRKLPNYLYTF